MKRLLGWVEDRVWDVVTWALSKAVEKQCDQ